jgi:hypothetical protein
MGFCESMTTVQLWRKLLPDLQHDLQGFPNEEISKSEFLEMVRAIRSFENIKGNTEEWARE